MDVTTFETWEPIEEGVVGGKVDEGKTVEVSAGGQAGAISNIHANNVELLMGPGAAFPCTTMVNGGYVAYTEGDFGGVVEADDCTSF